jgi:hypothetical protein
MSSFEDGFAQFPPRLNGLRMKNAHLSAQTGIGSGTLSQYQSGQLQITYRAYRQIDRVISICEALQARTNLPIDWQDVEKIKAAIAEYEKECATPPGELTSTDWNLLAATLASPDPAALLANLGLATEDLLQRLRETSRRFDGAIEKIRIEKHS